MCASRRTWPTCRCARRWSSPAARRLDILSGGRVELGLGAGAFWDAIAALGGPRWTPGQAVDALSEAIDVIRAVWGAAGQRVVLDGDYFAIDGAKLGPPPAHANEERELVEPLARHGFY